MKHLTHFLCCLLAAVLLLSQTSLAFCEEWEALPIRVREEEAWGLVDDLNGKEADSYVIYPVLETWDEAYAPAVEKINQAIQEKARIPEYLQLVSTLMPGGTGLKMNYQIGSMSAWTEDEGEQYYGHVLSLLFSAEGKMLSGRPSQVYYPMTFDLRTGDEITFDQVFTDPEGAKAFMESYLEEQIEPTLSTYLENNQLFPVPYDRFFLDSFGHLILVYENSQLSFLSGVSGAVSFRYSELKPWLNTGENSVVNQLAYLGFPEAQTSSGLTHWLMGGTLICSQLSIVRLGDELDALWHPTGQGSALHAAADSEYYPGGACFEVEEPNYRGALIITDENEEFVTGIQTSQWDFGGIETGKTALTDAEAYLDMEPAARIALDEAAANMYRVCPGTASIYSLEDYSGRALAFTLYADDQGIVRYVKLSYQ